MTVGADIEILASALPAGGGIRRPRPPRLIWPPLRPAFLASSAVHSWAVPFSCAARPPLLAISRCFSADIDANPRRSLRTPSTGSSSVGRVPWGDAHEDSNATSDVPHQPESVFICNNRVISD